jgi:Uma2 family endonuclease
MATPKIGVPRLESGDRLTRAESHRRYEARPDIRRAELIEGVVYVASPTRFTLHDAQQAAMVFWLAAYAVHHLEVRSGSSATLLLEGDNEVQPDAFAFRARPEGPGARPNEEGYLEGAPQLVVEVAASSAAYDLGIKKELYRRQGVLKYIVWRVLDRAIGWFRLQDGEYVRVEPDERGVIESAVFPGLRLHLEKMLAGDNAGVLAELAASPGDA